MINILRAAPHGTTDQMSPTHASVPIKTLTQGAAANRFPRPDIGNVSEADLT